MKFVVARKPGPFGLLLVVTDEGLLGKKMVEGKAQLDLSKEFYQGERMSEAEVIILLEQAQHLHLTGKEIIALAARQDVIDSHKVLWVQQVPHAEVVRA